MQCMLLFCSYKMKNITLSGSENNSKPVLQNPMHLKLKNSWTSELLTWFFTMTFCSWVFAILWMFQLPQHTYNYKIQMNANEILCWMLQLFNLYSYKMQMRFYVGCNASTIQLVQLQNANEILCWMLQLTQHIQLQNENDDLKGINYKMIPNTKWGAQPLLFVQKNPGWQSVL